MSRGTGTRPPTHGSVLASIRERLARKIAEVLVEKNRLLENHGRRKISDVSVAQAYGGIRGVKCMVIETSEVDPLEGIRFRGRSFPELRERLPKARGGREPLPEGVFSLLLTGEIPTGDEVDEITEFWRAIEDLPDYVTGVLDHMPGDTHPMTQLSMGIVAMQRDSVFSRRYHEGMATTAYWEATLDDAMILLARLPVLAAYIYRRTYRDGDHIPAADAGHDWAANLAHMMGLDSPESAELMRLYLSIHADHGGGNVSAHATHLVGSALSDPYLALSCGINGLAGPLHGLASQEAVRWIVKLKERLGAVPTADQLGAYVRETLERGQGVPGYGDSALRLTDPRYLALREFAIRHLPEDENFKIVQMLHEIVPSMLKERGGVESPWPNVDAHSGCLLVHYGVVEPDFYTVLFAVSRAMGVLASLVWDRGLGLPIERPDSVTTQWIADEITDR